MSNKDPLQEYLNNFTLKQVKLLCRYFNIPPTNTQNNMIKSLIAIENISKQSIQTFIDRVKIGKFIAYFRLSDDTIHYSPSNDTFDYSKSLLNDCDYCECCKKCYDVYYDDNLFWDSTSQVIYSDKRIFCKYLSKFTISKLKILCYSLNISGCGTKEKIINKIINESNREEIETIINTNINNKFIIYCYGYLFDQGEYCAEAESHYFYTNDKYDGFCHLCKKHCSFSKEYNLFFNEENDKCKNDGLQKCLNNFTVNKLTILCGILSISYNGNKKSMVSTIIEDSFFEQYLDFDFDEKIIREKYYKLTEWLNKLTITDLRVLCDSIEVMCDKEILINNIIAYKFPKSELNADNNIINNTITIQELNDNNTIIKQKNTKEKIPATIRNIVWNKYIGSDNKKGKCNCCSFEDISFANFHCGHIISEKNGGQLIVENLRPICGHCNSSIGTKNMEEFMEKYGVDKLISCNKIEENINDNKYNNVPEDIKSIVWIKYACNTKNKKCFVCNDIDLTKQTFNCGFLKPYNNNISNDISNFRPICVDCYGLTKDCGITMFMESHELINGESTNSAMNYVDLLGMDKIQIESNNDQFNDFTWKTLTPIIIN